MAGLNARQRARQRKAQALLQLREKPTAKRMVKHVARQAEVVTVGLVAGSTVGEGKMSSLSGMLARGDVAGKPCFQWGYNGKLNRSRRGKSVL